jgi:hypothetical protein
MSASVSYFYRPLPYYNGAVLKCAGIAVSENREWFVKENPGTIILENYRGDRIRANDLSEVK